MKKYYDLGGKVVIAITLILFITALFMKGFTHDLFLEAGVLLVSIKIIMMNYKNSFSNRELMKKLDKIKEMLNKYLTEQIN